MAALAYAKALVAVLTAGLVSVATFVAPDTTAGRTVTVALAVLGALGVYLVPNTEPEEPGQ